MESRKIITNKTNMPIRIAIIDDESMARASLRRMLLHQGIPDHHIAESGSVRDGLNLLKSITPDLLLLDIEMEDGTGFELLDKLGEIPFNVVFCTAHNEFAIRAFRYNAIDYLLKPVLPEDLSAAVEKTMMQMDFHIWQKQIEGLLHTASSRSFDRIVIPSSSGPIFIHINEIVHLESYGNYTFVFLGSGERLLASRNLKEFDEMLPRALFLRTHQSYIVQILLVKELVKTSSGDLAIMQSGARIPIARRKKELVRGVLGL